MKVRRVMNVVAAALVALGSSVAVADHTGRMIAEADRSSECVSTAAIDLEEAREYRRARRVFRDRRPDLYEAVLSLDVTNQIPL
jgi:N-carbamoylputrescine amidase